MNHEPTVYLNGEFLPISQAKVSVLDRGFIFGDGIYEVVPAYGGKLFRWAEHLARLKRSLAKIRITNPKDDAGWTRLVNDLIKRHSWADQFVYLQITRGVAKRDHAFPAADTQPTVFAMSSQFMPVPSVQRTRGVAAISIPDERWLHCDIKSTSLLGNVLAKQAAVEGNAIECVMFRDGLLTEGSASNWWVVKNGTVLGPPRDNLILEGIRVGLMSELCAAEKLPLDVRRITREEVFGADELMISSATKELIPVTLLDGKPVGSGQPGPIFERLFGAYQRAKAA
jgi:D-alanine transaminase